MEPQIDYNIEGIQNIHEIIKKQVRRFQQLRELVQELKFIPIDPIATYSSVTYKSIDGGKMGISFHPFEFDFIVIANSMGSELMRYLIPKSDYLVANDFIYMDGFKQISYLLQILGLDTITNLSNLLINPERVMELTEYACIFERLGRDPNDPIIVMKDGLLRTVAIKHQHIPNLISFLKNNPKRKLIGVAKSSQVINLISTALYVENKIPKNYTGFIEIPWEIERLAYKRSIRETSLYYSFGKLYIAKLCKRGNLLVTIEVPYDFEKDEPVYSKREIYEIVGHLIKDSTGSYPILGYPQTIMRAHEKAVRTGFSASIWRDKIINTLLKKLGDGEIKNLIQESHFLREYVQKDFLGGI